MPTDGKATCPAVLLMLTIVPVRRLRMLGNKWRMILRGAKKFVSIWLRASESDMSSTAPSKEKPALLTTTSILPWMLKALSSTFGRSVLQTSSFSQLPPLDSNSLTSSGVFEGLRDVAITLCPAFRARRARPAPKPLEQPVMNHTNMTCTKID